MSAKSFWNWVTNRMVAGTPGANDLFGYAPQPGVSLVTQAKNCTAADIVAAGGGGLDIGLRKVSAILTNANILALPTTPFQILAAIPGAYIVPIQSFWELHAVAAYTNIDADGFMGLGADGAGNGSSNFENVSAAATTGLSDFLGHIQDVIAMVPCPFGSVAGVASLVTGIVTSSWTQAGASLTNTDWLNKPWRVEVNNGGSGNFTGGNAANRIAVTLYYAILPHVL